MNTTQETSDKLAKTRQRFSDRIEFRRGKQDAERGRAPACLSAQYMAGYSAGRRSHDRVAAR